MVPDRELQVQSKLSCTPGTEKVGDYFLVNPLSVVHHTNIAQLSVLGIAAGFTSVVRFILWQNSQMWTHCDSCCAVAQCQALRNLFCNELSTNWLDSVGFIDGACEILNNRHCHTKFYKLWIYFCSCYKTTWKLRHLVLLAGPDAYRKSKPVSSLAGGTRHVS